VLKHFNSWRLRACLGELHAAPDPKKQLHSKFSLPNTPNSSSSTVDLLHEKRWSRPPTPWFSWSASRGTLRRYVLYSLVELGGNYPPLPLVTQKNGSFYFSRDSYSLVELGGNYPPLPLVTQKNGSFYFSRDSPPPTRRRRHLASSSLLPRVEALGHGLAGVASRGRARLPRAESLGHGSPSRPPVWISPARRPRPQPRRRATRRGAPLRDGQGRDLPRVASRGRARIPRAEPLGRGLAGSAALPCHERRPAPLTGSRHLSGSSSPPPRGG
jgi:hypothetical protein